MPPRVLAAELHFSCRFHMLVACRWIDLGVSVRETSAFYKQLREDKQLCCKLKNNSDHAKST